MLDSPSHVLCINGGSSNIKFAVFEIRPSTRRLSAGQIELVGAQGASTFAAAAEALLKFDPGLVAAFLKIARELHREWFGPGAAAPSALTVR